MSFFKQNPLFQVLAILSFGVALYAIVIYITFTAGEMVHPEMKNTYSINSLGIYVHIFASSLALLLGPFLLNESFRKSRPKLHRSLGKVYMVVGVILGGLSALYMSFYAFGGMVSTVGFGLLAIVWIYTGAMGVFAIMRKDFLEHRRWMFRNYALTFAAVTIRVYIGLFFAAGFEFEEFYPMLSWLCWVPNILLVEWWIVRSKN